MQELFTTSCNKCGKTIVFIRTERGTNMPCNALPLQYHLNAIGELKLYTRSGKLVRCDAVDENNKRDGWGYMPHWTSCVSSADRERLVSRPRAKKIQVEDKPPMKSAKKDKPAETSELPQYVQSSLFPAERRSFHPDY